MFVRVKTSPNSPKKAVQIVEKLFGNKVKQRMLRLLPNIDIKKVVFSKCCLELDEMPVLIK